MRAWGLSGVSGGLASGPMPPGWSTEGPWPRAGRRLRAAPRGTGWGPAAGRGRRSGGSGSLPLARAQESAEGRAEAPGWAAPRRAGGRAGGASWGRASRELRRPSVRPPAGTAGASRAAGVVGRGGVAGPSEWLSVGGRARNGVLAVSASARSQEACAPLPAPLENRAGAGRPWAGGPRTLDCVRSRPTALGGSGSPSTVPSGRRLGPGPLSPGTGNGGAVAEAP